MGTHTPDCLFKDKTLLPGQGHEPLAHDHDVLTLVLHGRLDEVFGAETQSCRGFELHFKPAGARHATRTGPDGVRMFLIGFRGAARDGLALPSAPAVHGGGVPAVRALGTFESLAARAERERLDRASIRRLVGCLARQDHGSQANRPSWITELHEKLRREPARRTSLDCLAGEFRCHPLSLARAFRRHYGTSISSFRRRIRVDRAIDRLTAGARSLADLAFDLGYADQSHLTRELKREAGWSPGRLRSAIACWGRKAEVTNG